MRDPARIDRIINKLRFAWHGCPDIRLGQLLYNLARDQFPDIGPCPELFYLEDSALDALLDNYNKTMG